MAFCCTANACKCLIYSMCYCNKQSQALCIVLSLLPGWYDRCYTCVCHSHLYAVSYCFILTWMGWAGFWGGGRGTFNLLIRHKFKHLTDGVNIILAKNLPPLLDPHQTLWDLWDLLNRNVELFNDLPIITIINIITNYSYNMVEASSKKIWFLLMYFSECFHQPLSQCLLVAPNVWKVWHFCKCLRLYKCV